MIRILETILELTVFVLTFPVVIAAYLIGSIAHSILWGYKEGWKAWQR